MKIYVLKSERFNRNSRIADRFRPIFDFCYVNYMIAIDWINSKAVNFVDDVHLHFSVSVAVVGIVDGSAIGLVIERLVQGKREDLVENLQDLDLEIGRFDLLEHFIEHIFHVF